jgi:DNA-directed RNA polymerase subunit E'/Rpb7
MILTENIYLNPDELGDIKSSIKSKLEILCQDYCSQEIGYITSFIGIKDIRKNFINKQGDKIMFVVDYEISNFKPTEGKSIVAKITHIFEEGVILEYIEKIRILIPKHHLNSQGYYFENKTYKGWKIGYPLSIVIDKIRYEKGRFDCIANLKV